MTQVKEKSNTLKNTPKKPKKQNPNHNTDLFPPKWERSNFILAMHSF